MNTAARLAFLALETHINETATPASFKNLSAGSGLSDTELDCALVWLDSRGFISGLHSRAMANQFVYIIQRRPELSFQPGPALRPTALAA